MKIKINKNAVGGRIKQIRLNKGYTLESFGKLIQASKSNVQNWEKGLSLPNKERLLNISKIAGLTVNELLYGSLDEYIENNLDTLFRNKNILNHEYIEKLLNEHDFINKLLAYYRENNININDIDSVNRGFNHFLNNLNHGQNYIATLWQNKEKQENKILSNEIYNLVQKLIENNVNEIFQKNMSEDERKKEFSKLYKKTIEMLDKKTK